MVSFRLLAIRWTMTSVSVVEWKSEPSSTSWRRSPSALVRLPLWAIARPPKAKSAKSGCTLRSKEAPVVA